MNNNKDKVEEIYQRVAMYKITHGVSYRDIAKELGYSNGVMEKLTGKTRRMTDANLDKLVTYLDSVEG